MFKNLDKKLPVITVYILIFGNYSESRFIKDDLKKFTDFKNYFSANPRLKEIIGDYLLNELDSVVAKILKKIDLESGKRFVDYKSINLFNNLIQVFVDEISRKIMLGNFCAKLISVKLQ